MCGYPKPPPPKDSKSRFLPLVACLALVGCGHNISLDAALQQTQEALINARNRAAQHSGVGFYPCQMTASYTVNGSNSGGLQTVKGSTVLPSGPTLGLSSGRGSTVTVTFKSKECGAVPAPGELPIATPLNRSN